MKKYIVELATEEQRELRSLVRAGKAAAYKIRHASILLKTDANGPAWKDADIAEAFDCHVTTVENVRRRFVLDGFEAAVDRRREGVGRPRKLDGDGEAKLIALACSAPPDGRTRSTLRLLAEKLVELKVVDSCSRMVVHRTMKKTS